MNPNHPGQFYRGQLPNGAPKVHGPWPGHDIRSGNMGPGMASPLGPQGDFQQGAGISRAEKFEDEKRRIIESCFGKQAADGSPMESYITHVRVTEDEDYPSIPPAADSPSQKKKPRVIIIAVRRSGQVRMHKGRENQNGTFSIGKTWPLEELQQIESFANSVPKTAEQHEFKQRAQDRGFIVTMQKPYYWQTATNKEKEFFIFSLIKIFRKYTKGKLPQLEGFNAQELEHLGGLASAPSTTQARPVPNGVRVPSQDPPRVRGGDSRPPDTPRQPPDTPRYPPDTPRGPPETSRGMRRRPSQDSQSSQSQPQERPLHSAQVQEHRVLHSAASRDRALRQGVSSERMRLPGSFPSTDSIPSQSSQQLRPKRSQSPGSQRTIPTPATNNSRAPSQNRYGPPLEPNQLGPQPTASGRSSSEQSRPNGYSSSSRFRAPSQQPSGSSDERPRTATKESDVPPALDIRNAKQRRPSIADQHTSRSEQSNYTQSSSIRSPDPTNGDLRAESRQGRYSDRDHSSSTTPSIVKNRSTSDVRSTKLPSQDRTEILEPPKPEEPSPPIHPKPPELQPTEPESLSPPPDPESQPEAEAHRPGLGPMIKKKSNKEIASKFRKAAMAANAFKPQAATSDDRKERTEQTSTGDGITGVFQAPSLLRNNTDDHARLKTPIIKVDSRPSTPEAKKDISQTDTATVSPQQQALLAPQDPSKLRDTSTPTSAPNPASQSAQPQKPPVPVQDERSKKRRSDHSARYAKSLGVNPSLLEGRTFEIEAVLSDFGWGEDNSKTTFEELETGIRKELARVEAGSWLSAVDNHDDRTAAVSDTMDKVMAECEELDCLLTLYNAELGTLSEDVAYIEAQSQGLQVQTANQKLLRTELRNLLDTISISSQQLRVLQDASLTKTRAIQEVESTLGQLFTAMLMIDPKLRHDDDRPISPEQASLLRGSHMGYGTSGLSSMHAVREKKELYRKESVDFVQRLKQYMSVKFRESEAQIADALSAAKNSVMANAQLDDRLREKPKRGLWMYSPLMLFAREIEPSEWEGMIRMYEASAKKPYQDEFMENIAACKRLTRKPPGDESEILFTAQEKESESLVGRKLTVKRTKTIRADGSSRVSSGDRPRDGKMFAYESFAVALTDEARIMIMEQNFIVEFFHLSSLSNQDFVDAIASDPESRHASDLLMKRPFDPNRTLARKAMKAMEEIFSFWATELQGLLDWSLKQDAINGVGMLFAMECQIAEMEESNQEFITHVLTKLHDRLAAQFTRFIEEQIRGIEDTKVKIKKRKGLIAFMKIFPNFSTALENMLPPTNRSLDHLPIRGMVDDAYNNINKAMFESLKFIAKESPSNTTTHHPTTLAGVGGGDPEDKEALNHHILLIENMHHYTEEVSPRSKPVLESWISRARQEFEEHLSLYLASIIRRPLGKLLDFLESTETLVNNNASSGLVPAAISQKNSHSRSVAKKVFGGYDAKEVRRGVETLRKRVEKHFSEGEGGEALVGRVWTAAEGKYNDVLERSQRIVKEVYECEVEVGWGQADVKGAFRR